MLLFRYIYHKVALELNVRRHSAANSNPLWLYLSASSVNRVLLTKSMRLLCCWFVYALYFSRPSCQSVTDAGQSKCRVERNQALEQARRPQESMFIPECNEDGTFAQVRLVSSSDLRRAEPSA